jgi:hypothetical protein
LFIILAVAGIKLGLMSLFRVLDAKAAQLRDKRLHKMVKRGQQLAFIACDFILAWPGARSHDPGHVCRFLLRQAWIASDHAEPETAIPKPPVYPPFLLFPPCIPSPTPSQSTPVRAAGNMA